MMTEAERIAEQLRLAHEGDAWHGPSLKKLLEGVSAEQASARPIEGAHTIAELVRHIEAWERVGLRRLEGDSARIYETEENWPASQPSEDDWRASLESLRATSEALRASIARLDDARLDEPIMPEMASRYVTLHGIIQHTLYHAGQIALLRKALGLSVAPT